MMSIFVRMLGPNEGSVFLRTLEEKARFVIGRARSNGVEAMSPIMAVGWINYLNPEPGEAKKEYTVKQVVAAFKRLEKKGEIDCVVRNEAVWLDLYVWSKKTAA